jgi:hypothetical protein
MRIRWKILDAVNAFRGPGLPSDDVTLVIVKVKG